MNGDSEITRAECALRCGAYKEELKSIHVDIGRLERIVTDGQKWQAEHDGKINAYWNEQFRINKDYGIRLSSIERKVVYASGAAAMAGAVIGIVLTHLVTRTFG